MISRFLNKNSTEDTVKDVHTLKSLYKISIETRNFEINQLIQRNNFFMLFQGVLLSAVMQTEASKPYVEVIICITGFLVSIYQLQMASGAKYWQEWWESRVEYFEDQLCSKIKQCEDRDTHKLFTVKNEDVHDIVKSRLTSHKKKAFTNLLILGGFSVGRAPIKVSFFLIFTWIALFLTTLDISAIPDFNMSEIFTGLDFK
ncbi:RipA family octameric membrane protein [Photobacterium leiognathi]|uniref:RipA family octameric membrane protein n=1 Tax=Photobacterium leiognathi TaxID=553611 RepID=UPI0029821F7D|nr:hypothetical protein [Photobacterium leiognathi]